MNKVLLVGAGAETDLGLPAGADYTIDTFYTRKPDLYEALRSFYAGRLVQQEHQSVPGAYAKHFLFNNQGTPFNKLLENLLNSAKPELESYSGIDLQDMNVKDLTNEQRKTLFNLLINENDGDSRQSLLSKIKESSLSAHYGTLEPLFSSMLTPAKKSADFWRLVNFYWSAFFSILLPLYKQARGSDYPGDSKAYSAVLNDLTGTLEEIFSPPFVDSIVEKRPGSYCSLLAKDFDAVLTTNYTPFARCFAKSGEAVYLAGKLTTFENPCTLEVKDVQSDPRILKTGTVFPYMMGQCPVKPIVAPAQIEAYSRAMECLSCADMLYVLGYSFSDNDGHIISIARDHILKADGIRMTYLAYAEDASTHEDNVKEELATRLRLDRDTLDARVRVAIIRLGKNPAEKAKAAAESAL